VSKRVAPNLTAWVGLTASPSTESHKRVCAELRALLAVARAAKTLKFFPAEHEGRRAVGVTGCISAMERALSRLDKVSHD
jgi:hypothetical protein